MSARTGTQPPPLSAREAQATRYLHLDRTYRYNTEQLVQPSFSLLLRSRSVVSWEVVKEPWDALFRLELSQNAFSLTAIGWPRVPSAAPISLLFRPRITRA